MIFLNVLHLNHRPLSLQVLLEAHKVNQTEGSQRCVEVVQRVKADLVGCALQVVPRNRVEAQIFFFRSEEFRAETAIIGYYGSPNVEDEESKS